MGWASHRCCSHKPRAVDNHRCFGMSSHNVRFDMFLQHNRHHCYRRTHTDHVYSRMCLDNHYPHDTQEHRSSVHRHLHIRSLSHTVQRFDMRDYMYRRYRHCFRYMCLSKVDQVAFQRRQVLLFGNPSHIVHCGRPVRIDTDCQSHSSRDTHHLSTYVHRDNLQ